MVMLYIDRRSYTLPFFLFLLLVNVAVRRRRLCWSTSRFLYLLGLACLFSCFPFGLRLLPFCRLKRFQIRVSAWQNVTRSNGTDLLCHCQSFAFSALPLLLLLLFSLVSIIIDVHLILSWP